MQRAEKELAFIEKNNISCYYLTDTDYPVRLRECPDTPILFYFKGNTDLDATRIISIVGTRNATKYGRELTESLIKDLAKVIPDLLVVSGLAYGIDICAHRNALYNRLPTVAVLAHGLDRIYPSCHRNTAVSLIRLLYGWGRIDRQRHRTRPSKFPPAEPDCRRNLGLYDRG